MKRYVLYEGGKAYDLLFRIPFTNTGIYYEREEPPPEFERDRGHSYKSVYMAGPIYSDLEVMTSLMAFEGKK